MKNQLSSIPISSFRHEFDFVSVPVSTKGETRVAVHASALFNKGEVVSLEDAKMRAHELNGTRYTGTLPDYCENKNLGAGKQMEKIYFVFKRNSRFALRLDIMKLRNQYKTK
jgi:hypothetical protein